MTCFSGFSTLDKFIESEIYDIGVGLHTGEDVCIVSDMSKSLYDQVRNSGNANIRLSILSELSGTIYDGCDVVFSIKDKSSPTNSNYATVEVRIYVTSLQLSMDAISEPMAAIPVPQSSLSLKDLYEKNKSSMVCLKCGAPTKRWALCSSVIQYCPDCCG